MTKESLNSSRTPSDGHLADTNPNSAQTLAASCSQTVLTLSQGAPVSDTASSQTLGQNGPVLLQDVDFIENLHISTGNASRSALCTLKEAAHSAHSALPFHAGLYERCVFTGSVRIHPFSDPFLHRHRLQGLS